jgi:hypothetical protein
MSQISFIDGIQTQNLVVTLNLWVNALQMFTDL